MNQTFTRLKTYLDKSTAYTTALALIQWDIETLAPKKAAEQTGKMVGILSDEYFNSFINPEVKALLEQLETKEEQDTLTIEEKAIVRELRRAYEELETVPSNEYSAYSELTMKSSVIWAKAREEDDFEAFAPVLKEIIEYNKRFASYRNTTETDTYNILLSNYEPSLKVKDLDEFFHLLKEKLVPLIHKVAAKQEVIDDSFNYQNFPVEKQKEFCEFIAQYIGFDLERGVIAESAHPFTLNLHNKDVRITNHFYEENLISAILSIIHEGGHGIYELNIADEITQTLVGTGASMAVHESQSRFYENMIGKNQAFWEPIYGKLQATFPEQLNHVSLEAFVRGINKSVPGLIRTEADELTYSMHVLIRYEIEKMIFAGEITVEQLPEVWNKKYEEYLGVTPKNNASGVLQDTHWAWGNFGYFPSYAVGSAVAAQIYYHMKKEMDFEGLLREGKLDVIKEYLKEHIHQYGMVYDMNQLLERMTGEAFNPNYYVTYLTEKYVALYELS